MTAVKSGLDEVAELLLGPLLKAKPPPDGWRLLEHDFEQGACVSLERRGAVVLVELEPRDDGRPCFAKTARFNVLARYRFSSAALDASARAAVGQLVKLLELREAELSSGRPPEQARPEVREVEVTRVLKREGRDQYYLNPYAGCLIGCPYCYVAARSDLSRGLEGLPKRPWGRYADVKVNAAAVLREEVKRLPPGWVRMSPILTDPYQPLERKYRITRQCLEVLLEAGFRPMILTRARLIEEDLPLLARFDEAMVGISTPTDDDAVRARFEPLADPIEDRLAALRAAHGAGLFTFAVVQPTLPMNPKRLVELLAPHVRAVRIDRMHELKQARPLYEAAGCTEALSDAFAASTLTALREGFAARDVPADDADDLVALARSVAPRRGPVAALPAGGPVVFREETPLSVHFAERRRGGQQTAQIARELMREWFPEGRGELHVFLESHCQQKCEFCEWAQTRDTLPGRQGETLAELARTGDDLVASGGLEALLDEAAAAPAVSLTMTGYDWLRHAQLDRILSALERRPTLLKAVQGPPTALLDEKLRARVTALPGLVAIRTTLQSSDPAAHDEMVGRPGAGREIFQVLERLDPRLVELSLVLTRRSVATLSSTVRWAAARGLALKLQTFMPEKGLLDAAALIPEEEALRAALEAIDAPEGVAGVRGVPAALVPARLRHLVT